jgi:hypothetical protein
LDKAFAVLESKGFADTVNLFFNFWGVSYNEYWAKNTSRSI